MKKRSGRKSERLLVLPKVFAFLQKKQKAEFAAVLLALGVSAALTQFTPLAIGFLTDNLLAGQDANLWSAAPLLLAILAANVLNEIIKVARRLLVEDTATCVQKNARKKAAEALLKAPLAYYRTHMTGNIHGRLNRNLEGLSKLIKLIFMDFAPAAASAIAAIIVIFTQLPAKVACVVVLVIPMGTLLVIRQISTQNGIRVELMESKASMDGTMVELLGGIETIRSMDSAQLEADRIAERSEQLRQKEMRHHKAMAFYDGLKFINEAVFNVIVIALAVLLASRGQISIGTVLTSYLCFTQLTSPLRELHRILDELAESLVLAQDYFSVVELAPDFSYQPALPPAGAESKTENEIELTHVSMAYAEKPEERILHDLSFSVKKGSFVGIAGPSGCGKSSLIKAIAKMEPYEGSIKIAGRDLSELIRAQIAGIAALVPQTPFIFADTIYNNICYGINRKVSAEEVEDAARRAGLAEMIEQLDGKYQFMISQGGGNLSGGQRQRIALARIFLRRPQVLILDVNCRIA